VDVDGARVSFPGGWAWCAPPNTGPVLVLRCEADSPERLAEIRADLEARLHAIPPRCNPKASRVGACGTSDGQPTLPPARFARALAGGAPSRFGEAERSERGWGQQVGAEGEANPFRVPMSMPLKRCKLRRSLAARISFRRQPQCKESP